ncbi:hypothetical protein ACFL21_02430 [Patescibacteria group bacterium]
MKSKLDLMSQLLRDMEMDIGTRDLANLVFEALIQAIKSLKVNEASSFCKQFSSLSELVCQTEPKFGILNYHFVNLSHELESDICGKNISISSWKKKAISKVKLIVKNIGKQEKKLLEYAETLDVEGKTILIHDHSHTVQDVLSHFHRMKKHFRVIIVEQDFEKTHSNIEKLHSAQIPFQVVPAYMISHVIDNVDMLFFGALTLKDTMDFVMSPGTHGVITEFYAEKVPIYMFMNTTKFSLWKSKKRGGIFIHKHQREHHNKPIQYERIKYSHDRVHVDMFKRVITNEGAFTPTQIESLFNKKLVNYLKKAKATCKTCAAN